MATFPSPEFPFVAGDGADQAEQTTVATEWNAESTSRLCDNMDEWLIPNDCTSADNLALSLQDSLELLLTSSFFSSNEGGEFSEQLFDGVPVAGDQQSASDLTVKVFELFWMEATIHQSINQSLPWSTNFIQINKSINQSIEVSGRWSFHLRIFFAVLDRYLFIGNLFNHLVLYTRNFVPNPRLSHRSKKVECS